MELCNTWVQIVHFILRQFLKVLWEFCKIPECHTHSEDTGTDATVIRYLIADDGAGGGVYDEPDVGFDAADFDVCLICGEHVSFFVGVLVNKGLDTDSGQFYSSWRSAGGRC